MSRYGHAIEDYLRPQTPFTLPSPPVTAKEKLISEKVFQNKNDYHRHVE